MRELAARFTWRPTAAAGMARLAASPRVVPAGAGGGANRRDDLRQSLEAREFPYHMVLRA